MTLRRDEMTIAGYVAQVEDRLLDDESVLKAFAAFPDATAYNLAADYTEIFAYTFPLSAENISHAYQGDDAKHIALSEVWAERLFLSKRATLLLPSYRVELSTLRHSLNFYPLGEIADATTLLTPFSVAQNSPFAWLNEIEKKLANGGPTTALSLLKEIYQHAPGLMLFLHDELRPQYRLRSLLRRANFSDLPKRYSSLKSPGQDETTLWWMNTLKNMRTNTPKSSNTIDALALTALQRFNADHACIEPTILVTRSRTMRKILFENETRKECRNIFMMHPGMLGSFLVAERTGQPFKEVVENRYWISKDILKTFRHSSKSNIRHDSELVRMIDRVRSLWSEIDDSSIAHAVWTDSKDLAALYTSGKETLSNIADFIKDQSSVRELLRSRALDVGRTLRLSSAGIAAIGVG